MQREWLVQLRKAKKLTITEVAAMVGITPTALCRYEQGGRRPRPETAQKLGKVLDFDWTRFYE